MATKLSKRMSFVLTYAFILVFNVSAFGNELEKEEPLISLQFDIENRESNSTSVELEDGTTLTLSAEPVQNTRSGLNGVWRIWGDNGLAKMVYYIDLTPSGNYTSVSRTYGLSVTGRLTGVADEKINVVRRTETSSRPAIVEGYAKFNYLENQWVSIWTSSGGVRTTIRDGVVDVKLY